MQDTGRVLAESPLPPIVLLYLFLPLSVPPLSVLPTSSVPERDERGSTASQPFSLTASQPFRLYSFMPFMNSSQRFCIS